MADPQRTLTPPETIPRRSDVILMGGKGVFFWLCVFFLFTIAQPQTAGARHVAALNTLTGHVCVTALWAHARPDAARAVGTHGLSATHTF